MTNVAASRTCAGLLLGLIALVAFSNSMSCGWVLDNKIIVVANVQSLPVSWSTIESIWTHNYWWPQADSNLYRPVTITTYLLNWALRRADPSAATADLVWGFHAVNLGLHWINAILVRALMLRLTRSVWVALYAAILFVCHPITIESVTNIVGRADELAVFCLLTGLLIYIRYSDLVRHEPGRSREVGGATRRWTHLVVLGVVVALGLFSKESAVVIGLIIPLYDLLYNWPPFDRSFWSRVRQTIDAYVVLLLALVAYLLARHRALGSANLASIPYVDNPISGLFYGGIWKQVLAILTAGKVAGLCLCRILWPVSSSCTYSYNQIPLCGPGAPFVEVASAVLACFAVVALVVLAMGRRRRSPAAAFLIGISLLAYLPMANLLFPVGAIMAERFMYGPLVGFVGIVAMIGGRVHRRLGPGSPRGLQTHSRLAWYLVLGLIPVLYISRTRQRNKDWQDDISIWTAALDASPHSFHPYESLAFALYLKDPVRNLDRCIALSEKALQILDDLPDQFNSTRAYMLAGLYYGRKGDLLVPAGNGAGLSRASAARRWYEHSALLLERGATIDRAWNRWSHAEQLASRPAGAPVSAPLKDHGLPGLYDLLGVSYTRLGLRKQALQSYRYAIHLDPVNADYYLGVANVHALDNQLPDVAVALIQVLTLDPTRSSAWDALAQTFAGLEPGSAPCIRQYNGKPELAINDPRVHGAVVRAYQEFVQIYQQAGEPERAQQARDWLKVNGYWQGGRSR